LNGPPFEIVKKEDGKVIVKKPGTNEIVDIILEPEGPGKRNNTDTVIYVPGVKPVIKIIVPYKPIKVTVDS
jgi:hypothetical protein